MKMEADRMTNLVLAEDEVLRERDVVLEERSQRVDNNPSARFAEQMNAAQFLHHPYGMPVIGWRHEIEVYSREDSLDFYRTWYAPNNAVLLVAGDIDAEELKPLAEKYYGGIPARDIPERVRVQEPPQEAERTLTLRDMRVRQPSWLRSYLAPSFNAGETEHAYPLTILADVLGGTSTSRLYRALVVEQQIATSAGSYYRGSALDLATFKIYASPKPGVDLDALEAAIDAELERLVDEPITEAEVARATKRMVAEAVYARDSMSGAVRSFGIALTTGRTTMSRPGRNGSLRSPPMISQLQSTPCLRLNGRSPADFCRRSSLGLHPNALPPPNSPARPSCACPPLFRPFARETVCHAPSKRPLQPWPYPRDRADPFRHQGRGGGQG